MKLVAFNSDISFQGKENLIKGMSVGFWNDSGVAVTNNATYSPKYRLSNTISVEKGKTYKVVTNLRTHLIAKVTTLQGSQSTQTTPDMIENGFTVPNDAAYSSIGIHVAVTSSETAPLTVLSENEANNLRLIEV